MISDWGSSADERARAYPCDAEVQRPNIVLFRAIDIAAPPALVFRWLCQLRVAPYSYDWLDNWGRQSPRIRDPRNEALEVGQPMVAIFRLASFERDRQLTLLDERGPFGRCALSYVVSGAETTRLVVKIVARLRSPLRLLLPFGDFVMMRKQLLTLKALAEAEA